MDNTSIVVSTKIAQHLESLPLDGDANGKLRALLVAEYRRRLARYRMMDRNLKKNIR